MNRTERMNCKAFVVLLFSSFHFILFHLPTHLWSLPFCLLISVHTGESDAKFRYKWNDGILVCGSILCQFWGSRRILLHEMQFYDVWWKCSGSFSIFSFSFLVIRIILWVNERKEKNEKNEKKKNEDKRINFAKSPSFYVRALQSHNKRDNQNACMLVLVS